MSENSIRPFQPQVVLSGAPCVVGKAVQADAVKATGGHSKVVRGVRKAGNDSRYYGFYHKAKPYLIGQHNTEELAIAFAKRNGYEFDGEADPAYLTHHEGGLYD